MKQPAENKSGVQYVPNVDEARHLMESLATASSAHRFSWYHTFVSPILSADP
jgi:hypothetical protein